MIIAEAPPPPLHIPAPPILPPFCFNTLISVTIILDPEFPRGCPIDTAPPLTSTFSGSNPRTWYWLCQPLEMPDLILNQHQKFAFQLF